MAKQSEGMRIGPISLLTLISVLLLAVLAMLCITTANATYAMANRQAESTSATYAIDSYGQAVIAQIDGDLKYASGSPEAAASAISAELSGMGAAAAADSGAEGVELAGQAEGRRVTFTATSESGKTLAACVRIDENLDYAIESWQITTTQQAPEETLWSGTASGK